MLSSRRKVRGLHAETMLLSLESMHEVHLFSGTQEPMAVLPGLMMCCDVMKRVSASKRLNRRSFLLSGYKEITA